MPRKLLSLFLVVLAITTTVFSQQQDRRDGHPAWIMQGNIYEVNIRQYTPEGTFKAFEKHLVRLQQMGVQTLWFMPINPISKLDRKGSLGSYYAISDYTAINPEFGDMSDWISLVKNIHALGMKVIIDWVPNHTGADHYWLQSHPDFFDRDSTGKFISPFDWTDVRKLNYKNPELQDSMIEQMRFWIKRSGIDGFRCDVASAVPDDFWKKCITALQQEKNIFMLAEGDRKGLHEAGFDATYTWNDFNMMKLIAKGERKASALDSTLQKSDTLYPPNALRMFFTSNHDENSWNKADYETMPGDIHAPFAVLTQTLKRSVPLIYSGQEEPVLRMIRFFDKDTITFAKYKRAGFYKQLLRLHSLHPALAADAPFTKLSTSNDDAVYAFYRGTGSSYVLVIANLSNQPQQVQLNNVNSLQKNNVTDIFKRKSLKQLPSTYKLPAWGYTVISRK